MRFDGESSQKVCKQGFDETTLANALHHEESLFCTSLVPLQIHVYDNGIWKNVTPSRSNILSTNSPSISK